MLLGESLFLGEASNAVLHSYRGQFLYNGSLLEGNVYTAFPVQLRNGLWIWQWEITNANFDGGGDATQYRYIFGQTAEMVPDFAAPCVNGRTGAVVPGSDGKFLHLWGEGSASWHSRYSVINFDGTTFSVVTPGFGFDGGKINIGQVYYGDPSNDGHLIIGEIGQNGPDPGISAVNPNTAGIVERWGIQYAAQYYSKSLDGTKWIASRWSHWFFEYNADMKGGKLAEFDYGIQGTNVTAGSSTYNVYAGNTNRDGNNQYKPVLLVCQRGFLTAMRQLVLTWGGTTFARITHCIPSPTNPNHFYFVATGDLGTNAEQSYHGLLIGCIDVAAEQMVWHRQITSNGSNPQFVVQGLKISQGQLCIAFRDLISTGNRYYSRFLYGPADNTFPIVSVPVKINLSTTTIGITAYNQSPPRLFNFGTVGAGYQNTETFSGPNFSAADLTKLTYVGMDTI